MYIISFWKKLIVSGSGKSGELTIVIDLPAVRDYGMGLDKLYHVKQFNVIYLRESYFLTVKVLLILLAGRMREILWFKLLSFVQVHTLSPSWISGSCSIINV